MLLTACSREVSVIFARFRVIDCLLGGSSCRVADLELRASVENTPGMSLAVAGV